MKIENETQTEIAKELQAIMAKKAAESKAESKKENTPEEELAEIKVLLNQLLELQPKKKVKVKKPKEELLTEAGRKKIKKVGKVTGITLLIAALLTGTTIGAYTILKNLDKSVDSGNSNNSTSQEETFEEETTEEEILNDEITAEIVETKSTTIMNQLTSNNIDLIIPDLNGNPVPVTKEDITSLIYWCNYNYLTEDQKALACDMDRAALMIAILVDTYDMSGLTSQQIAGISGLPTDPNAGNYTLDYGVFFLDNTLEQEELSRMSSLINEMKNNPTQEGAQSAANQIFEIGVKEFIFEDSEMFNGYDKYLQANFFRGMIIAANQNAQNASTSITYLDALYDNYGYIVENINEVDGPLNAIGRDIEETMNDDSTRTLG